MKPSASNLAPQVDFVERTDGVLVKETFDAETENPPELQRTGWQAIFSLP